MYLPQNFPLLSVIMERFRQYEPVEFINACFAKHDEHHRNHLLGKYMDHNADIFQFMPYLDVNHMEEVNRFMNDLIKPDERHNYEYMFDTIPPELFRPYKGPNKITSDPY